MIHEKVFAPAIPSRVSQDLSIKIGDFGLTREINQSNYYTASQSQKCPVKWMSPEMLRDGISSEKSDVVCWGHSNNDKCMALAKCHCSTAFSMQSCAESAYQPYADEYC